MLKDVIRNFTKFTGKHLCQSLFFNKVAGLRRLLLYVAIAPDQYHSVPNFVLYRPSVSI